MIDSMKIGFADHSMAILLMLLVAFLLGLLLGYILWYTYKKQVAGMTLERDQWHNKYIDLEKSYASLKYQHDELGKDNTAMRRALNNCEADKVILENKLKKAIDASAMGAAPENAAATGVVSRSAKASPRPNDLKIVEGIGPKIEQLLKDAGINSWTDLSNAPIEKIQEVLSNAGSRYKLANPSTWPKQAGMAAAGKWDELKEYQDYLKGGKEV